MALGPHDFRGVAAKIHLHFHPGDYGSVAHLLGHSDLKTTMKAYTVDEAERAAADFDRTILRISRSELDLRKPPSRAAAKAPRSPLLAPGGKPGRRSRGQRGRS